MLEIQEKILINQRICPMPREWNNLWEMLPDRKQDVNGWIPALPLILGGWWSSSDEDKKKRFLYHLNWAKNHGVLNEIIEYLNKLPEDRWYHLGD